jgi:hypothetical protein
MALFGLFMPGAVRAAEVKHPHMHHVLYDIKEAIKELQDASSDFGGYKGPGIVALKVAAEEVEKLLGAVKDPVPADYKPDPRHTSAYKDLKHLRHAEVQIEAALKELKASQVEGIGEHKERAIKALEQAWLQVFVCQKYAPK